MWTGRRVAFGLTAIAAIAILTAFIGALLMPSGSYCSELGTPTSEAVMIGGLLVAALAVLLALLVAVCVGELATMGLALLLIAPGAGVVLLAADRYSAWGCG